MPVLLVIMSIVLVTAARLRRPCGAGATTADERNRRRWLSPLMARRSSWRATTACMLLLTGLAAGGLPSAQTSRPLVYVVPIEGMIDLGLAPLLARTIREAEQAGAAAVVLDINTLGGRVDAAIVMRREIAKFAPGLTVIVHSGTGRTGFPSALRGHDVVITSYDTAVRDLGLLKMVQWHFVVLDEAQAIKNAETLRSRTVREIPKRSGLAVTGTPVENRLEDLWSILEFSSPGVLGPLASFRNRFENTLSGAVALQPAVSPLILRRRVAEVANDLPERIDIPVAIQMPGVEAAEYERIRQETLNQYGKTATLVALTKLREFCTHPFVLQPIDDDPAFSSAKYVRLIEILDEVFAAREKVIVFTSFQRMLDILVHDIQERFGIPAFWIDGRTPVGNRQPTVDRFSDTVGAALIALNPRAAGTGSRRSSGSVLSNTTRSMASRSSVARPADEHSFSTKCCER